MNEYDKCFIGIPLPDKFLSDYQNLLDHLRELVPNGKFDSYNSPHTTIAFIGRQAEAEIEANVKDIVGEINYLNGVVMKVGGFGVFEHDEPNHIVLPVQHSYGLTQFAERLRFNISARTNKDFSYQFNAHMTVCETMDTVSKEQYWRNQHRIAQSMNAISWEYYPHEVALWGKKIGIKDSQRERIATIKF